eukprot:2415548-Amphidinium_carterae.1
MVHTLEVPIPVLLASQTVKRFVAAMWHLFQKRAECFKPQRLPNSEPHSIIQLIRPIVSVYSILQAMILNYTL